MNLLKVKNINFFLIILSFFIAFLCIEIILKYFYPQNLSGSWRFRHESGLIMNKNSGEAKHFWKSERDGELLSASYSFGKYHNRTYKDLFVDSLENKVLILGGSDTFGWLLNDSDTFVYKLQKKFVNKSFINAATAGWGIADYLKYTELYCKNINPKEVWLFLNNDEILRSIKSNLYKIDNDDKLIKLTPKISFQQKVKFFLNSFYLYQWLLENFHSIQLIRNIIIKIPDPNISFNKEIKYTDNSNLFIKNLLIELKKETNACDANLKLFFLGWPEFDDNKILNFINLANKENFFVNNSIDFYNLLYSKYMVDINKNLNYYKLKEGHPNKFGNNQIFLAVQDVLNK
jgi:hypothetical protein